MKTTKRTLAALLAVMMLALMIPFTASAAANNSAYLQMPANQVDVAGTYTFDLYKVASYNATTGQYTVDSALSSTTAVVNAVKNLTTDESTTSALISALDDAYATVKTITKETTSLTFNVTDPTVATSASVTGLDDGLYYVHISDTKPAEVSSASSSLFAFPNNSASGSLTSYGTADSPVSFATKVSTSAVTVHKTFGDGTSANKEVGSNDTVSYKLTASKTGSADNKLTKYAIVDTMDAGLTLNEDSIVVKDGTTTLTKTTDYTVEKNYIYETSKTATFAVVLTAATLEQNTFYNTDSITVEYNATLNANAKLNTALPNADGLVYNNGSGDVYANGDTVNVKTFGLSLTKINGNTNANLAGAKFQLFNADDTAVTVGGNNVYCTSTETGNDKFVIGDTTEVFKTASGVTYKAKEITAPTGFTKNSTVYDVTVGATTETTSFGEIPNYPLAVPQTGGMGTMMFTIGGAALIVCGGVLLFILMRKKKTAE